MSTTEPYPCTYIICTRKAEIYKFGCSIIINQERESYNKVHLFI